MAESTVDREPEAQPDPIFVSVKTAAAMLDVSPWYAYKLLDEGKIESRYQGRRRSVVVSSLHAYADALPEFPPAKVG